MTHNFFDELNTSPIFQVIGNENDDAFNKYASLSTPTALTSFVTGIRANSQTTNVCRGRSLTKKTREL